MIIGKSIWKFISASEFVEFIQSLKKSQKPKAPKKPRPVVSITSTKKSFVIRVNRKPKRITIAEAEAMAALIERPITFIGTLCAKRKILIVEKI